MCQTTCSSHSYGISSQKGTVTPKQFLLAFHARELCVQYVSKEFLEKRHILDIIVVFDSLSFSIIVVTAAATS